jgi:PKD repeat protein
MSSTCTLGFGQVISWSWDFGDGTPAAPGQNATHVYAGAGTFTVMLSITTDYNVTTTASRTITVSLDCSDGVCHDPVATANGWAGLTIAVAGIALVFTGTVTATKRRYTRTNARITQLLAPLRKAGKMATGEKNCQRNEAIECLIAEARRRQLVLLPNLELDSLENAYRDIAVPAPSEVRAAFGKLVEHARGAIQASDLASAASLAGEMRATINRATVTGIFSAEFKKEAGSAVDTLVQLASAQLEKCRGQLDAPAAKQASGCRVLLHQLGYVIPRSASDQLLAALSRTRDLPAGRA